MVHVSERVFGSLGSVANACRVAELRNSFGHYPLVSTRGFCSGLLNSGLERRPGGHSSLNFGLLWQKLLCCRLHFGLQLVGIKVIGVSPLGL